MTKVIIGGQIDKDMLKELVVKYGEGKIEVDVKTDVEAAMAVQSGGYSYYFGACNTGGGGALAMAIAILGADKCVTLNTNEASEIVEAFNGGKIAFGFTPQYAEEVIKNIIKEIIK